MIVIHGAYYAYFWHNEAAYLMFQSALEPPTPPLLSNLWSVETSQVFEPLYICRHSHSPLLKSKELCLPFVPRTVGKVLLQEPRPEGSPRHLLPSGLHQLLHPLPPILRVCHQEKRDKQQPLLICASQHSTDLLTLPHPSICLVRSGLARELGRPVFHEILHGYWPSRCHYSSGWRRYGLHRVHHTMDRLSYVISSSGVPPPPVSHSSCTPHIIAGSHTHSPY